MKFSQLGNRGISHVLLPLLVIVAVGVTGAYLAVASHADSASRTNSTYLLYSDGGAYDGVTVTSSGFTGASCKKQALPAGKSVSFAMPAKTSSGTHPVLTLVCTTPTSGSYSVAFVKNGAVPNVPGNPQQAVTLANRTTACLFVHSSNSSNGQGVTRTVGRDSKGGCSGTAAASSTGSAAAKPKAAPKKAVKTQSVYMVGDSITVGARGSLRTDLLKHYRRVKINGSVSRSIIGAGITKPRTSGMQAIVDDQRTVKNANVVIIELGTNYNNNFETTIGKLVDEVRQYNKKPNLVIYWVDVFSQGPVDAGKVNDSIARASAVKKFEVIHTVGKGISLGPDHVHPDISGSKVFAQTVADGAKPVQ